VKKASAFKRTQTRQNALKGLRDCCSDEVTQRRGMLRDLMQIPVNLTLGITALQPVLANASEDNDGDILPVKRKAPKKPFAPLEALLPAARVKVTIDESVSLVEKLEKLGVAEEGRSEILSKLCNLIVERTTFMTSEKGETAKKVQNLKSNTKLYDESYKEQLQGLAPTDVPLALFSQAGERRQFRMLQKRQKQLEKKNSIREALNFYTRQLQFDTEYYILNSGAEEKKKMIRDDALPDIKSVIVSDLDLRDLVRNQILDAWDDVQAEFLYQIKNNDTGGNFDTEELLNLLLRAQNECDRWFNFIAENDVTGAIEKVKSDALY
jgi:hypothetical protein